MNMTRTLLVATGFAGSVVAAFHFTAGESAPVAPTAVHAQDLRADRGGASAFSQSLQSATTASSNDASPSLIGSSGRVIDLGGKTVAQYVAQYQSAARLGDADAAYKVYLAESLCAPDSGSRDSARGDHAPSPARLCAGVTPAEVQERLHFLALAARTGQADAQVDFYLEGPDGTGAVKSAGADQDSADVERWKNDALDHLKDAAGKCNPLAAGLLATSYSSGKFNAQDPSQALAFDLLAAAAGNGKWSRERLQAKFGASMTGAKFDAAYADGLQAAREACPQARQ